MIIEIVIVFIIFFVIINLTSNYTILGIVAFIAFCFLFMSDYKKSKKKQIKEGAEKIKEIIDISYSGKHEFEEVKIDDCKDFDLNFYNQKQKEFELCGFSYIADYVDKTIIKANPNSKHLIRVMLSHDYSTEAAIFDIKTKGYLKILQFFKVLPQDLKTIELESEFENGRFLATTTTKMDLMNDSPKVFKEIVDKNMATGKMVEKHFKRILEHEKKFNTKHILIRNKEEMFQSQARLQKLRAEYRKQLGGVITKEEMDRISKGSKIGKEVREEIENLYKNKESSQESGNIELNKQENLRENKDKRIIKITSRLTDELKKM